MRTLCIICLIIGIAIFITFLVLFSIFMKDHIAYVLALFATAGASIWGTSLITLAITAKKNKQD
jgi:hypothetical protein